jgi:hypothetical protein
LVAVTPDPDWATVAFQALVSFWSPGKSQFRVQPLTAAVPLLVTVTVAVNPPPHSFLAYETRQVPPVPSEPPVTVHANAADPETPVVSVAETVTLELPAAVGVPVIRPDEVLIDSPAGSPAAE